MCVATEIDFIFGVGGVDLKGFGQIFWLFGGVVGGVGGGCCLSLLLFGVVLWCVSFARYPSPVPRIYRLKLSVLKRLKVFKQP